VKRLTYRLVKMLAALAIGVLLAQLAAFSLGFFWHLTHDGTVRFLEWRFRVPAGFCAVPRHDHPEMIRFKPIVPFWPYRSPIAGSFAKQSTINIFGNLDIRKSNAEPNYVELEATVVKDAISEGLTQQFKKRFDTAAGPAICLQFGAPSMTSIRCYFQRNTALVVLYDGEPQFSDDVYSLVREIAPVR